MENLPSIPKRDDGAFEGSTVQRAQRPLLSSVGSTASAVPFGATPTVGAKLPASTDGQPVLDDAETVIRRSDSDSVGKMVPATAPATPAAVAGVLLGTRLNHFLLEEMIGGGGMGAVFRARDDRLDRVVAIKVIPFVGDDPDLQRRFRNEAQNAARLDHPYIARVFDVGQFEQWHYIVFEYVDGINLRDMVARDGVLPIDDAVYYARQIAEAIEHANGRGIVHRDIKPSNVLVGVDGNVKVVDMGLARSQQFEVSGDMTASGVTLGTFDYISPEQARDPRDADVRSDIYSLGCTLYYLLTASPPYPGGTMLQKLLSHGNAPPPDPRGLRPEVSDNLTAIIHKMLAKDPAARYPRAIDVVADFRELAMREGLIRAQSRGTLTVTSGDPLPRFMLRHVPWMIAAALVLMVAGWLQFASSASREQFTIAPPPSSYLPRREADSSGVPIAPPSSAATSAQDLPQPVGTVTQSAGAPAFQAQSQAQPQALSDDVATAPPRFQDVARPATQANLANRPEPSLPSSTVPIERIVVGAAVSDPAAKSTSTLAEAIKLAEELQVNLIEIASGVITSPPIQINRDDLTIRSSGGNSEIRFVNGDSPTMQRVAMIDVGSNRLAIQNLHLSWNVRGTTIEGGTLFRIASDNHMVRLADSTITVENLAERDEIYAFEIENQTFESPAASAVATSAPLRVGDSVASSSAQKLTSGESPTGPVKPGLETRKTLPMVAIELDNVSARGEMTLISLVDAAQLQFHWRNGLLAVSRRMLEATGADVRPALGNNQIQISLDKVTAWTPEGLVRVRLGQSRAYPMLIDRKSNGSAFYYDPAANHIEFDGLESAVADPGQLVQLRGDENAYDFTASRDATVLLLGQWNRQVQKYGLPEILAPEKPSWITDRSLPLQWVVRWAKPVPNTTPSRLTVGDFLQDGTIVPGFDKNRLPQFPIRPINEAEI